MVSKSVGKIYKTLYDRAGVFSHESAQYSASKVPWHALKNPFRFVRDVDTVNGHGQLVLGWSVSCIRKCGICCTNNILGVGNLETKDHFRRGTSRTSQDASDGSCVDSRCWNKSHRREHTSTHHYAGMNNTWTNTNKHNFHSPEDECLVERSRQSNSNVPNALLNAALPTRLLDHQLQFKRYERRIDLFLIWARC